MEKIVMTSHNCVLRHSRDDKIICVRCKKVYGNVGEVRIKADQTSCTADLSFFDKATNFARSASKHVMNGAKMVDQQIKDDRLSICQGCEFYNKKSETCNKCGCYLSIKTGWASESCPEGKWKEAPAQEMKQQKKCGGCRKKS